MGSIVTKCCAAPVPDEFMTPSEYAPERIKRQANSQNEGMQEFETPNRAQSLYQRVNQDEQTYDGDYVQRSMLKEFSQEESHEELENKQGHVQVLDQEVANQKQNKFVLVNIFNSQREQDGDQHQQWQHRHNQSTKDMSAQFGQSNFIRIESQGDMASSNSMSYSGRNTGTPMTSKGLKKVNLSMLSQSQRTCLQILNTGVYAHENILEDNLDKKFISDNLQQTQKIIDISTINIDPDNLEFIIRYAIKQSDMFREISLPPEFFKYLMHGAHYQFEDSKFYKDGDKLFMKAFFFNTQQYLDNEEFLSQSIVYQSQMLRILDKTNYYPILEQEIILKDGSDDENPIAYIVFIRQPRFSLFNVIFEGWLNNNPIDTFSKEKLIFYLMQTIRIISDLHNSKYCTMDSILLENIYVDPVRQKLKFSSPAIFPIKPLKQARVGYLGLGYSPIGNMEDVSRVDLKNRDAKGIAKLFFQIAKQMNCKDSVLAQILKSLIATDEISLSHIFSKADNLILSSDPMFYYKLSDQYIREKKSGIALEVIQIQERIMASAQASSSNGKSDKYTQCREFFEEHRDQAALVYQKMAQIQQGKGEDTKALGSLQRALVLLQGDGQAWSEHKETDKDEVQLIQEEIKWLKQSLQLQKPAKQSQRKTLQVSEIHSQIGQIYLAREEFEKSLHSLLKSLLVIHRIEGSQSALLVKGLQQVSAIYKRLSGKGENREERKKMIQKSTNSLQKALTLLDKCDGMYEKMELAQVCNALGQLLKDQGKVSESIQALQKGIDALERLMDEDKGQRMTVQLSVQLAGLYKSVAFNNNQLKNYEESVRNFEQNLKYCKLGYGEAHEITLNTVMNLGMAHQLTQNHRKTIQLFELGIKKKYLENKKEATEIQIQDMHKLMRAYKQAGDDEKAHEEIQKIIKLAETIPNLDKIKYGVFLQDLARIRSALNLTKEGLEAINKALEIFKEKFQPYNESYIQSLLIKGDLSLRAGLGAQFQEVQEECIKVLSDALLTSQIFEKFGNKISGHIFDQEEYSQLLCTVCGPIDNIQLYNESRGKEKWRMFVTQCKQRQNA